MRPLLFKPSPFTTLWVLLLGFLLVGALVPGYGQESRIRGYVFVDTNRNGKPDPGEKRLADVGVSNQLEVVQTDRQGAYSLPVNQGFPLVFISLPAGFGGPFYSPVSGHVDFPLQPIPERQNFSFIHASDTHLDSLNLPRIKRFREMADSLGVDFVIITGDLVRDALRVDETTAGNYYERYVTEIEKFSMPVFSAVGNHELFGIERDKSLVSEAHPLYGKGMYQKYLGPNYYSFNYGDWHFVALDAVQYQNLYYYGGVDSLQLQWLEADLKKLPLHQPVVTFNHIPLVSPGFSFSEFDSDPFYGPQLLEHQGIARHRHIVHNSQEVFSRIGKRPYPLALAGHYHMAQEATFEGSATLFSQTAAISGPDTFSYHGLPGRSGFTYFRVSGKEIASATFIPLNLP